MSVARLFGENGLIFLVGLGLLPVFRVAPTLSVLKRLWGVAYLTGMSVVGVAAATLASFSVPFPPIALVVGAAAALVLGGLRIDRGLQDPRGVVSAPLDRAVSLVLVPVLAAAAGAVGWAVVTEPLREWDGWAIWGLKAHAIAALGSSSGDVIASRAYYFSHLEYPLLLPGLEALGIRSAGGYESRLVVIQGVLVGFAGLLAIWGLLRNRVRPALLWPTIAALASAPAVLSQLASGYADMPLAFFVAPGVVAAACWLIECHPPSLALATLFLAAGALTKDEGDLFAIAAYVALLLVAKGRRRPVIASALAVGVALVPWRIFIAVNHFSTAPAFKLTRSFDPGWLRSHGGRAPTAFHYLVSQSLQVSWYALLLPIAAVAVCLALARGPRSLAFFSVIFSALSLLGLSWIYVISDIPLHFYLAQTQTRVTASVLVACAALAPLLVEGSAQPLVLAALPADTSIRAGPL